VIGIAPNEGLDGECAKIVIESGKKLTVKAGRVLNVYGDWVNNGNADLGDSYISGGKVKFCGSGGQKVYGANNWINIEFTNGLTFVSGTGAQNLYGVMNKTGGTLVTNNQLTVKSISTPLPYGTTACIDSGVGVITGNVTVERYLPSPAGYKYISIPVGGINCSQVVSQMSNFDTSTWGADYSLGGWTTFWMYDETNISQTLHPNGYITDINQQIMQNGWVCPSGPNEPIVTMRGYIINDVNNKVISFTGPLNDGDISYPLTYTSSTGVGGSSLHDGWHLLGNPYPCPIDWTNNTTGWDKRNILPTLYFFKPNSMYYGFDYIYQPIINPGDTTGWQYDYIGGISIPYDVEPIIASGQSFFVKVDSAKLALPDHNNIIVKNGARVTNLNQKYYKKNKAEGEYPYLLRLELTNRTTKESDQTVVYIIKGATLNYDPYREAIKTVNDNPAVPMLYSSVKNVTNGETCHLAINAIPYFKDTVVIPITLGVGQDAPYMFKVLHYPVFSAGEKVYLYDKLQNVLLDLGETSTYGITLSKGTHKDRFYLKFVPASYSCKNPDNLWVTNIVKNGARLNWSKGEGVDKYMVRWREKGENTRWYYYTANSNESFVSITGLKENTEYEWQMRTLCMSDMFYADSFTALQTFKTGVECSSIVIGGRQVSDITSSKAVIKFYQITGVDHYLLRYRKLGDVNWNYVTIPGYRNYQQLGCDVCEEKDKLQAGTEYEWQMRAFCKSDNSSYSSFSSIMKFKTLEMGKKSNIIVKDIKGDKGIITDVYPNPAKDKLNINYEIGEDGNVLITVYNVYGLKVAEIDKGLLEKGRYSELVDLKSKGIVDGVYMINLKYGDILEQKKIIIINN